MRLAILESAHNYYQILQEKGLSASDALRIIQVHSRDNGRTLMQWDDSKYAGFTDASAQREPWIQVNENHSTINVKSQIQNPDSIFAHYQKLVQMRKGLDVSGYQCMLSNYPKDNNPQRGVWKLRAYESMVWYQ